MGETYQKVMQMMLTLYLKERQHRSARCRQSGRALPGGGLPLRERLRLQELSLLLQLGGRGGRRAPVEDHRQR